ncbi:MAG TPA: type II toxin-antitoxin system RelE/ParE family toxin [Ginsengibacter sp.]
MMRAAAEFLYSLDERSRKKVSFNIRKTMMGLKGDWFEKMRGTNDLFEFRTLYNHQYIRLFAFWDTRNNKKALIICTHGLLKKLLKHLIPILKKLKT